MVAFYSQQPNAYKAIDSIHGSTAKEDYCYFIDCSGGCCYIGTRSQGVEDIGLQLDLYRFHKFLDNPMTTFSATRLINFFKRY